VSDKLAELAERRAARHVDPLIDEKRREPFATGSGDTSRVVPDASAQPERCFGRHDRAASRSEGEQQEQQG
jgi:hypothetical protein